MDVLDRLIQRTEFGECWVWRGAERKGYGDIRFAGKQGAVHRAGYLTLVGEVPKDTELDHLCREPLCWNPDHLEPVSHRENVSRGDGPTADNGRKTHCLHGHAFDEENTYVFADGHRRCRACNTRRAAERRARQWGVRA